MESVVIEFFKNASRRTRPRDLRTRARWRF
jgi:hypothetical protein